MNQFRAVFRDVETKEKIDGDRLIKLESGSVCVVEAIIEFPKSFVDLLEAEKPNYSIELGIVLRFHDDTYKKCLSRSPILGQDDAAAIELHSLFSE